VSGVLDNWIASCPACSSHYSPQQCGTLLALLKVLEGCLSSPLLPGTLPGLLTEQEGSPRGCRRIQAHHHTKSHGWSVSHWTFSTSGGEGRASSSAACGGAASSWELHLSERAELVRQEVGSTRPACPLLRRGCCSQRRCTRQSPSWSAGPGGQTQGGHSRHPRSEEWRGGSKTWDSDH